MHEVRPTVRHRVDLSGRRATTRHRAASPSWRAGMPAVLLAALAACGGGGGDGPTPVPVPPTISLAASTLQLLGVGTDGTLSVTVGPVGSPVTWTSEQPAIATVTGTGTSATVRSVGGGTATIVAAVTANGLRAEARATVTVVPLVRSVTLAPAATSVTAGSTVQLTPTVVADPGASTALTWTSSDQTRATVSSDGMVTGIAPGPVTVTATSVTTVGVSGQATVTVNEPPRVRSVTVTPTADSALVGQARTFTAAVVADPGLATTVTWRSSAPTVALVSPTGVASALAPGSTTITAVSTVDTTMRASATLTVRAPTVFSVTVTGPSSLVTGASGQATAAVSADPGVATSVIWSSTNGNVATVNDAGLITAIAPGTTTIRATSTAVPSVLGALPLTVSAPPFLSAWGQSRIGIVGGQVSDGLASSIASLDAGTALATYWAFADGSSPYASIRWTGGQVTDVGPPAAIAVSMFSLSSAEPGLAFAVNENSKGQVFRWSAGTWTKLPTDPPAAAPTVHALSGNRAAVPTRVGTTASVQLWDGSAWSLLFSVPTAANATTPLLWIASPSAAVLTVPTSGGTHSMHVWNGSSVSSLPLIPGNPANATPVLMGSGLTELYALAGFSQIRVYRWNGVSWTELSAGLPAGDNLRSGTMCAGQLVLTTVAGRVLRWTGSTFERLGTDADNLPERFFGTSSRPVSCASDGTLRVAGGEGSLARWTGSAWVTEAFSPSLRDVRVVSPTLAWATGGAHSVYRWNGTTWSLAYRSFSDAARRVMGLAAWPDGRFIGAYWSSIIAAGPTLGGFGPQGVLRFDGTSWTSEINSDLQMVNAVWGPSYDNAFAASGDGRILRFNGASWETVHTVAGAAWLAIGGTGSTYGLAITGNLRTIRWNGTSWTQVVASVPGATDARRLYVAAPDDAWSHGSSGEVYRFNGTTWSQVDMSGAGGSTITWAIFGTGPEDVYILRGATGAVRLLYRWNGSAWSQVASFAPTTTQFPEAGSAVPGFGVIVGNNGATWTSTGGQPFRGAAGRR